MVQKNVPLAQQVVNEILTGIERGVLAGENGLLPSETELCRRFEVSRATVREALSRLEQRGVVIRRHGVGTFLAPSGAILEAGLERLESLTTIAHRMGLETSTSEVELVERAASALEAAALNLQPDAPVLSVTRVICTAQKPFAYLIDVLPTACLPKAAIPPDFTGSVLDLLITRSDPPVQYSRTDILTDIADTLIARKLNLHPGELVLKLEAQLYARDGRVVDASLSYFVPGFFRFRVMRRIDPCDNSLPQMEVKV